MPLPLHHRASSKSRFDRRSNITAHRVSERALAGWMTIAMVTTPAVAQANSLDAVRQLLATKQCLRCDLSNAGLVMAQLSGANLQQSNLSRANLSQSNLTGANLAGANLAGASLAGANLAGANLMGADLRNADLRNASLSGAQLEQADLTGALLLGAIDLPLSAGSVESFYAWGMEAAKQKRFEQSVELFSAAIVRDETHAPSFLARAIAKAELRDKKGAIVDLERAGSLYKDRGETAQSDRIAQILTELKKPEPEANPRGGNGIGTSILSVLGGLLQFFVLR